MIWFFALLLAVAVILFVFTLVGAARIDARFPSTGQMVDVDGVVLHCVVQGQPSPHRPSLVFVHGASSNHREFMIAMNGLLAERFGPEQHVLFVDRPGQGGSDRQVGDHSPTVQAQRILAACKLLGAQSVIAIGHSWGGAVVAQMAQHGGEYLKGAVFCAPATHPWPGNRFGGVDWFYAVADWPIIGWLFTRLITLPVAWSQIDDGVENVFSPEPPKPGYAKALGARLVLRPEAFRANASDVHRLLPFVVANAPAYTSISCPVHILTGDADGVVWPQIHSDGLERDIQGARKTVIPGGGHMPHQTHPELVIDAIEAILAEAP
ncbi:MAG: alpha/beta fold hydrolase [Devosiaceae bacterium]